MKLKTYTHKAFTLVEILVVVVIVGLLAGIAVMKLADSKDRAETNYLKSVIHMVDSGIERVIAVDGTFPTLVQTDPESRLREILLVLQDKDIFVYMDNKFGPAWQVAVAQISSGDLKQSIGAMLDANHKARNGLPTGAPFAKEILVLPVQGPVVYPERATLVLNDPSNPNLTYHYQDYWLPKKVDEGIQNLLNGGFANAEERNLVMSNLGLTGLDEETFKGLLLNTENSAEHSLAANQLAAIIRGDVEGGSITPEVAARLLDQMLTNKNYDPAGLDLSGVDLADLNPLALDRVAQNAFLSADQVSWLLEKNRPDINKQLLNNSFISDDAYAAVLDGVITPATVTSTVQNMWQIPNNRREQASAKLVASLDATNIDAFLNAGGIATLSAGTKASAVTTATTLIDAKYPGTGIDSAAARAYDRILQGASGAGSEGIAMETKQALALKALQRINYGENAGLQSLGNLVRSGGITATPEIMNAAYDKFVNGSWDNAYSNGSNGVLELMNKGSALLTPTQKQGVRDWIGGDIYKMAGNNMIFANADIYPDAASLQPVLNSSLYSGLGDCCTPGWAARTIMQNPNVSTEQKQAIMDYIVTHPSGNVTNMLGYSGIVEKFTPDQQAQLIQVALNNPTSGSYSAGLGKLAAAGAVTPTQADAIMAVIQNSSNYTSLGGQYLSNALLTEGQLSALAASPNGMKNHGGVLTNYLLGGTDPKNMVLSEGQKENLVDAILQSGQEPYQLASQFSNNYNNLSPAMKAKTEELVLASLSKLADGSYGVSTPALAGMSDAAKAAIYTGMVNSVVAGNYNQAAYDQSWMSDAQFDDFLAQTANSSTYVNYSRGAGGTYTDTQASAIVAKAVSIGDPWSMYNAASSLGATSNYVKQNVATIVNGISAGDAWSFGEVAGYMLSESGGSVYKEPLINKVNTTNDLNYLQNFMGSMYGENYEAAAVQIATLKRIQALGGNVSDYSYQYTQNSAYYTLDDRTWLNSVVGIYN